MFLALKELKHGKFRFLMIGVITVLIAWLVFILAGLGNGLSALNAASIKNVKANYVVFEQGARASMSRSVLDESLVDALKQQANVTSASPMGSAMATIIKKNTSAKDDKVDIAILGVKAGSFLEPKVIEGSQLHDNKPGEVIVNDTLKDKGYQLGDTLVLDGSLEKMTIAGFVKNETYSHAPVVFVTLDKWRKIQFAAPGADQEIKAPVNAIMLQGKDISPADIENHFAKVEVVTKAEAVKSLPGYKEENGTIMMMLVFLLTISAFVLGVFFYVLTLQKSNQFGILKAMGSTNGFLGKAVISQVFIISLFSILVGIILTYGTALILPEGMPFALDPELVVIYAAVLLIISILSSLFSVRRITRIDPLQAIGRVE